MTNKTFNITCKYLYNFRESMMVFEFMPKGVTKEIFKKFVKYYDKHIFILAGKKIRNIVKRADELSILERIQEITKLFSYFKNPDKETVLTPWKVVNRHITDCLGGYNFYDENFENTIETPKFINHGQVTTDTLANLNAKILEINSKTGLYPLFVTYNIFRAKIKEKELAIEEQEKLWEQTIKENIFVICKTPMAKSITKRTLVGFKNIKINAHYFDDLIMQVEKKSEKFTKQILNPKTWNIEGETDMKFDAIVGNPPYQLTTGGSKAQAVPLYNLFINIAKKLNPNYISMIMPSRWFSGGMGLDTFREEMLNDKRIRCIIDYSNAKDCFPGVSISGGINYFLWDKNYQGICKYTNIHDNKKTVKDRILNEFSVFIRFNEGIDIIRKIQQKKEDSIISIVSSLSPFGIDSKVRGKTNRFESSLSLYSSDGVSYIDDKSVKVGTDLINKYKVMVSKVISEHALEPDKDGKFKVFSTLKVLEPKEVCTFSYFIIGGYENKMKTENLLSYLKTKLLRFLLLLSISSINLSKDKFQFVPMQDFNKPWTDEELYKKYNLTQEEINFIESMLKPMK